MKYIGDPTRVVIAEDFRDGQLHIAANPECEGWSIVSIPTLEYRMRGRKLAAYALTGRVKSRPFAEAISRHCRFIISLYGLADGTGDQAKHYAELEALRRKGDEPNVKPVSA
ncbi:hypothetical protein KDJ57_gp47 [Gordonia phage Catfish]|uniref:Uncharacterized protein n=1 Tax=Gordonia phage Catfish TaxID=2301538 RepID=A0A385D0P2_9CAUD|nr:hypothetical protein KDJ57_gp47 [Gordonia phage Catfish]AXQ51898.1 hypothetical protein SEA_CATFISH_62 [Gordonia phage Catfish]